MWLTARSPSSSNRSRTAWLCVGRCCIYWRVERNMKRLLKGGRVVDPANGRDGIFDILIDGERIARVGKDLPADGAAIVDIPAGFIVTPGLFDMHVHLREPGQEHKETVAT